MHTPYGLNSEDGLAPDALSNFNAVATAATFFFGRLPAAELHGAVGKEVGPSPVRLREKHWCCPRSVLATGCPADEPDCSPFGLAFGAALVIFDGIVQAGGLAIIGEGLFLRTSSRPAPAPKKAAHVSVRAVPLDFGKRGLGLGFAGTF